MSDLPPGPYVQLVFEGDGYGFAHVVDANCQPLAETFVQNETPGAADALAELLIRAEREADPTPIDVEWLVRLGGEVYHHNESIITVLMPTPDDTWLGIQVEWNPAYPEVIPSLNAVQDKKAQNAQETVGMLVPTRGTFRTAMRVLGIKIEEPNP